MFVVTRVTAKKSTTVHNNLEIGFQSESFDVFCSQNNWFRMAKHFLNPFWSYFSLKKAQLQNMGKVRPT